MDLINHLLNARYLMDGEAEHDMYRRVADTISSIGCDLYNEENLSSEFYSMLSDARFLPNTPCLANAGKEAGQLCACFVIPVEDNVEKIFDSIKLAALIQKTGGGTGFSFSRLRPEGDVVKSTGGIASGPVSFMKIFDAATNEIKQGGMRRGANMGVLRVDHPDIIQFIKAKIDTTILTNFNLSVGLTTEFMTKAMSGGDYSLVNPRNSHVTGGYNASEILDLIAEMIWLNGEPGILFLDEINKHSLPGEEIEATNPCITGDTLVYTDNGLRRIDSLAKDNYDFIATTDSRMKATREKSASTAFIQPGIKDVYRLSTLEGYELKLTKDHKVMTERGYVKAEDLIAGDRIHILGNPSGFGSFGNMDLGLVLGWFVGDGCYHEKNHNSISADLVFYDEKQELFDGFVTRVNNITGGRRVNGYTSVNKKIIGSVRLARLFNKYGLSRENHRIVPDCVVSGSKEIQTGFLSALFSADGTIGGSVDTGLSVRLTSINPELLQVVQRLLLNFGIYSSIYWDRRIESKRLLPDGRGGEKPYLCKAYHELAVSKDNIILFADKIKLILASKQYRLEQKISEYKIGPYRQVKTARFESLEYIGSESVYDITEPATHSFIANGMVISNCGEVPTLPYGSCNLGSINVSKFINDDGHLHEDTLKVTTEMAVTFLDNVIDASVYPCKAIEEEAKRTRSIGLGVMGFADALIKMGIKYNSKEAVRKADKIMQIIKEAALYQTRELAKSRGSCKSDLTGQMRNANLTAIAPTGSISIIAECSSGIEPLFGLEYDKFMLDRKWRMKPNIIDETKNKDLLVIASDVDPIYHLEIQAAFQRNVDHAVSKTINLPNNATKEDIVNIIKSAWKLNLKGVAIFRDLCDRTGAITSNSSVEAKVKVDSGPTIKRGKILHGTTKVIKLACGNIYVTVNAKTPGGPPVEVFLSMGKAGGCHGSNMAAMGRLLSISLRYGVPAEVLYDQLHRLSCNMVSWDGGVKYLSCADAVAKVLKEYLINNEQQVVQDPKLIDTSCENC